MLIPLSSKVLLGRAMQYAAIKLDLSDWHVQPHNRLDWQPYNHNVWWVRLIAT